MGEPWLLVAFAAWCFAVALLGGLLGLVLGNIRLPLTLVLASSPAAGVGANIVISGVTAGAASVAHVRAGRFDRTVFAAMAPTSVLGVVPGAWIAQHAPGDALLVGIGALLAWFGIGLLRRPATGRDDSPPPRHPLARLAAAGFVIGVLGGIVGLILGALRMPALLRTYPGRAHEHVGTNLAVGFVVGIVGGMAHGLGSLDPMVVGVGCVASIPGALVGARWTGRLDEARLIRGIAVMLLVAGAATAIRGLL